jgi:thioredoxin reductase (NADPH)
MLAFVIPTNPAVIAYAAMLLPIYGIYAGWRRFRRRAAEARATESRVNGAAEPISLHPVVDQSLCLGCGACVSACPEGGVLGLVNGQAELVEPQRCIGHGACRTACPFEAISLVFGSAERGVDIPHVGPDFQTNVPGIFIAGELGGMGLIRNAIEQGRQAIEGVKALPALRSPDQLDVVIVGAGPAGLAAGLAAKEAKLRFVILEQDTLGGTIAHFPRGKLVMTQPAKLPIVGKMPFRDVGKEELISYWRKVVNKARLAVSYRERVTDIHQSTSGFDIVSTRRTWRARAVVLAIGRRGTPRRLGVPGEDLPKVVYRLTDPAEYADKTVLVAGGGDAALEAAIAIAGESGSKVTLCHRGQAFDRAKPRNKEIATELAYAGRLEILLSSTIDRIGAHDVDILSQGKCTTIENDAIIVCAGGVLPSAFLAKIGIAYETKYGTA